MYQAVLDKYSVPPAPEVKPELVQAAPEKPGFDTSRDAWKQYPSVVILSHFLRENKHAGVRLVLLQGRPTLRFTPSIGPDTSPERRDIIDQALELLLAALPDIEHLVSTGQHIIPQHPGYGGLKTSTGPSQRQKT
jgi:hypothetical protein